MKDGRFIWTGFFVKKIEEFNAVSQSFKNPISQFTAAHLHHYRKSILMRLMIYVLFFLFIGFSGFFLKKNINSVAAAVPAQTVTDPVYSSTITNQENSLHTHVNADEFVAFARKQIGIPYLYASTDPSKGFDCSGFVNYVSHHFGMKVPRSSVDFTNYGTTIDRNDCRPGDFILFTGTDTSKRIVGHMGIVTNNNNGDIEFIHSSSGKAKGVTISELEGYYETRFVKVIRVLS